MRKIKQFVRDSRLVKFISRKLYFQPIDLETEKIRWRLVGILSVAAILVFGISTATLAYVLKPKESNKET